MISSKPILATALALLTCVGAPAQPLADLGAERIRGHVEFLASDRLEGREAGSRGYAIAADYVASEYRKLGLRPGGVGGGWFQQVPLRRAAHAGSPQISILADGRAATLVSGRDFGLRPSLTRQQRTVSAPLVFVGHGISAPQLGIDEYAGLDVRGKLVVALAGVAPYLPLNVAGHLETAKEATAAAKGALGMIEIGAGGSLAGRQAPVVGWADRSTGTSSEAVEIDMALSQAWSSRLFAGAPMSLGAARAQAARGPVRGFALPARLRLSAASSWQDFTSPNVIGMLPGSDPALAAEHIAVIAHLDHIGMAASAAPGADAIYNGAVDNAAGVAAMIEAARAFVASGTRPRRSVLFVAATAEEQGMLGSAYFAAHPTVPVTQLAAAVNLDMPLLTYDFTDVIAFGADHSTIGRTAAAAAGGMGVAISADPMPQEMLFIRSDHYPFVVRGIPSVFLMTGHAGGGKAAWENYLATTYHKPADEPSRSLNWRAGARFAELNFRIARALADAPERPRWYRGDFFGDSFAPAQPKVEK